MQTVYAQFFNNDLSTMLLSAVRSMGSDDFEAALETLNKIVLTKFDGYPDQIQNFQNGLTLAQNLINIVHNKILSYYNITR
jgi:hypothetical protein